MTLFSSLGSKERARCGLFCKYCIGGLGGHGLKELEFLVAMVVSGLICKLFNW